MQARRMGFEKLRQGGPMAWLDAACNAVLCEACCGDALLHRTGLGLGVACDGGPFHAEGDPREIRPDMEFTIEPGRYLPWVGGSRHSDTVLVTESGCVGLTPLPDDLDAMTSAVWRWGGAP